jgi:hypothetical protein
LSNASYVAFSANLSALDSNLSTSAPMSKDLSSTPTLLGLPREVRDHILSYAIGSQAIAPPSPRALVAEKLQKNQRTTMPASVTRAWEQAGSVLFPHNRPSITHLPLLLVNYQLKAETEAVAVRSSTFTLDIVYLDDVTLWPTWTSLPHPIVPGEVIDELHVQWRLFIAPGAIRMDMSRSRGLFNPSDGGPPAEMWIYYHLLMGLLRFGPAGYRGEKPSLDGGIYIRKLIMNFEPPEEKDFVLPRERPWRNPNDQRDDLPSVKSEPSHELLAKKLSAHLGGLISLSYYTLDYG